MGITRLIYGRSAMVGLHLLPDAWYEDNRITTWLNTRAVAIDRRRRAVELGTGDTLDYDRLILAMGSEALVPPLEGYGMSRDVRVTPCRRCAEDPRIRTEPPL